MDKNQGYVYILTNPSFREDWAKVKKTVLLMCAFKK
jgi:hypothetical protein